MNRFFMEKEITSWKISIQKDIIQKHIQLLNAKKERHTSDWQKFKVNVVNVKMVFGNRKTQVMLVGLEMNAIIWKKLDNIQKS